MVLAKMVARAVASEIAHAAVNIALNKVFGSKYARNSDKNQWNSGRDHAYTGRKRGFKKRKDS